MMMASKEHPRTVLHADQEHASVRFLILAILVIVFIVAFLILNSLISNITGSIVAEYALVLSCTGGLVVGLVFAGIAEYILKRTWPSGHGVVYDDEEAEVKLPGGKSVTLEWSRRYWATKWYFSLIGYPRGGREKRLSARHYCLACQIQQDESRFIIYSYLPPEKAEEWLENGYFQEINPGQYYENSLFRKWFSSPDRPDIPASVLTGKKGSYWMAERRRWTEGIELTPDDFELFMNELDSRIED
jgi:hypothetical protein